MDMVLYFLRHGSAGESQPDARADQGRRLDRDGVLQSELTGLALATLRAKVDAIVSSPLQRARQSAQLVAREIGFTRPLRLSPALRPDGSYQQFLRLLEEFNEDDALLLVGHNSRLCEFVGKMISPPGSMARVHLKKGGVAKVRRDGKGAVLQWCIGPDLLRPGLGRARPLPAAEKESPPARRARQTRSR